MTFDRLLLFFLLLLLLPACASEEKLHDISGTATFKGKPIPKGVIYFDPDPTKGGKGTQGSATIIDGKYTTAVDGRGVRKGPYVVRITGFDGKAGNEAPFGKTLFNEQEFKKELPTANGELNLDIP